MMTKSPPVKSSTIWSALLLVTVIFALVLVPLAFSKQVFSTYRLPKAVVLWLSGSAAWLFFSLKSLKAKKLNLPPPLFFWPPLIMLAWLFLSSFFALRPIISFVGYQNSYLGFITYAALVGLYLGTFAIASELSLKLLFLRLVAGLGFFLSFWAWLQFFGLNYPSSFAEFGGQRVGSFIGNPNNLGGFLLFLLPLIFSYYFTITKEEKPLAALSLVFVFTAIVLTHSASALGVAFLVSLFYLVSFRANFSFKQQLAFLMLLLLLAFFLFLAVLPQEQASVVSRLDFWQAGLKMVLAKPLFGFGLDNLRYATPLYVKPDKLWLTGEKMADLHNIFINLAASAGLIPVLTLLIFVLSLLIYGINFLKKEKSWQLGLTTSLLGFVFFMQTTPDSPALLTYFWLTAGLLVASFAHADAEMTQKPVNVRDKFLVGAFRQPLSLKSQVSWVLMFMSLALSSAALFFSYQQLTADSYFRLAMRATTAPEALALTEKATASAPYYEYYYGMLAGKAIDMSEDVSKQFLPFVKEAATKGLKITPLETNLYAALGFYYLLLEPNPNYKLAKRYFKLALKKDPYNLNAVYGLSKSFFLSGEKDAGKNWLLTLEKLTTPENENLQELKRLAKENAPATFQKK